jgi:hypothetical protein
MTEKVCILQDDGENLETKNTEQVADVFETLKS